MFTTTSSLTVSHMHGITKDAEQEVFVIGFGRTPIGSFQGSLSKYTAVELMSECIGKVMQKFHLTDLTANVTDLIVGNVCQAGLKQAPANQIASLCNLPTSVNCYLLNKVCASGMMALIQASKSLMLGDAELVVAGGVESMSNAPHLLRIRNGLRYGNGQVEDSLHVDCLSDAKSGMSMGQVCELLAHNLKISRDEQDAFTISTYDRAIQATAEELLTDELVIINELCKDEELAKFNKDRIRTLQPAFPTTHNGVLLETITAASSSKLADGAAAFILATDTFCTRHGISPIAKIVGYAEATQEPNQFGTSPALAITNLLKRWPQYTLESIDLFEINEAFAVVALANMKLLGIPLEKCNVFGGAVAVGHPLGSSGARIVCTLINALKQRGKRTGIAAVCHGGGGATAILVELVGAAV